MFFYISLFSGLFYAVCFFPVVSLVVSTSEVDCIERLVSEMSYDVSSKA